MRLPSIKKILREDVRGAPEWISSIIEPVNSFMESVYQSLNHNVTFQENVAAFIKEIVLTTTSSYPTMDAIEFMSQLKTKAISLIICQAYVRATYVPVSITGVAWVDKNGTIQITEILGLAASTTYVIRFVIF